MNYSKLLFYDTGNSYGLSTTIWISGCEGKCPDCFNKETWDYNYGQKFTRQTFTKICNSFESGIVKNFVILGGEPLESKNIEGVLQLAEDVKEIYPDINIILYTGYTIEELEKKYNLKNDYSFKSKFGNIDYLIDGRFDPNYITPKRELRGSTNQKCYKFNKKKNNWIEFEEYWK